MKPKYTPGLGYGPPVRRAPGPMKESTKNLFGKLAKMTGSRCAECPTSKMKGGEFRCCDRMFCDLNVALAVARHEPLTEDKPNVGGIPFMGPHGCVLPPEKRPYCTGYVCPPHFGDRDFRREYDRTLEKIARDPAAPPMPEIMRNNRKQFGLREQELYDAFLKKAKEES